MLIPSYWRKLWMPKWILRNPKWYEVAFQPQYSITNGPTIHDLTRHAPLTGGSSHQGYISRKGKAPMKRGHSPHFDDSDDDEIEVLFFWLKCYFVKNLLVSSSQVLIEFVNNESNRIKVSSVREKGNKWRWMASSDTPLHLKVSQMVRNILRCWVGSLVIDTQNWRFDCIIWIIINLILMLLALITGQLMLPRTTFRLGIT